MAFFFPVAISFFGLFAVSGAVLLIMLVLRDPHATRALQNEGVAQGAAFVLTVLITMAAAYAANTFIALKIPYVAVLTVIAAILAASSWLLWRAFGIGKRLQQAEQGRSPFARERPIAVRQLPATLKKGV